MKTKINRFDSHGVFLVGCILLANLPFQSIWDYALRIIVGGFILMMFQSLDRRIQKRRAS